MLLVARRLMPVVLEQVARTCSPELFLLTVIAICFGTAFLTNLAGVSLSLGAFLAGLVVSESRFSQHALGEILPLQILFSATFFVSVGMLLDLGFLVTHLPLVLIGVAVVLLVKVLTTGGSVLRARLPLPVAAATGADAGAGRRVLVRPRARRARDGAVAGGPRAAPARRPSSPHGGADGGDAAAHRARRRVRAARRPARGGARRAEGAGARAPTPVSRTTSSSPATARPRAVWCACCTARTSPTSSRR